jgi:hypothetical protein
MMTIGDVLAVIATLTGVGVTSWALLVTCGLLFPHKVIAARNSAQAHVKGNIALGAVVLLPGLTSLPMLGSGLPMVKLLGAIILLSLLSLVAIGASGLGRLAGEAILGMDSRLGEYPAFIRGSAFLVAASMLPILGWFVFGPCVILASLGSGIRAMTARAGLPLQATFSDSGL